MKFIIKKAPALQQGGGENSDNGNVVQKVTESADVVSRSAIARERRPPSGRGL